MTQMVIGLFLLLTIGSPAAESNRNLHLFRAAGGEWHSLPSSELGRLWAHRTPVDVAAAAAAVSRHRFQLQLPRLTSTQTETIISGDESTGLTKRQIENSEIGNDAIVMSFPFCTRLTVNECHRLLSYLEQKMRSLFSIRRKSFPPQIKRRQSWPSSSTRSDLAEATGLSKFRRRLKRSASLAGNEASSGDERPETEIVGDQVQNDDDYDFLFDYEGEWTRKNDLAKYGNDQPKIAQKKDGVIQRKTNFGDGGNRMLQLIGVGRLRRSEFRAPNGGETVEELLRRYRLWREENGYGRQTGRWGRSSQPVDDDDVDDGNSDDDNDRVINKPETEDDQTTSNVGETNTDELPTDNRREIVMMTNENGNGSMTRKRRSLVLEIHWPTEEQLTPQDWEMLESYVSWRKQHGYGLFSNRWGR